MLPAAASLLNAWEAAATQSPARRALALLGAVSPQETAQALADLPIGQRDGRLLSFRESAFGTHMTCVARCPSCALSLELSLSTPDIRVPQPEQDATELAVDDSGYRVRFRLPSSADLLAIEHLEDEAHARTLLLEGCIREIRREGATVALGELPAAVLERVVEAMEAADPQAVVEIALRCPECGHGWESCFDVVSHLWAEVDGWARHTLEEVNALASAYGWSEAEILGMSARRRALYVGLATR